jgi:AraC-like DNA-binding protein
LTDTWRIPAVIWRALEQLGLPAARLTSEAGLPEAATDHAVEFSTAEIFRFWTAVERCGADPLLGFKMLRAASKVGSDSTFLAATRARTFGDALASYIASRRLHSPVEIRVTRLGNVTRYERHIPRAQTPEPPIAVDFTLGTLLSLGRVGVGLPLCPRYVELNRSDPGLPFVSEFYGCPIRFGASRNAIAFDAVVLGRRCLSHDPEVAEALQAVIAGSIGRRHAASDIGLRAREILGQAPSIDKPGIDAVARELGLSPRSFQRRLQERGLTYRGLVEEARLQPSLALLEQGQLSIVSIAHQLGYLDATSFSRAFRSWAGMAPREWRRCARQSQ